MKKHYFTLLFVSLGYCSLAQLGESSLVAGGSLQVYSEPYTESVSSYYSVNPVVGYVLAQDRVIGLSAAVFGTISKFEQGVDYKSTRIEGGIFYRKYSKLTEKLFFNWQLTAGILTRKESGGSIETSTFGIGARFNPGLTWTATNKLLVVSRVGNLSYFQQTGDREGGLFELSVNSFSLGLEFLIK